MNEENEIEVEIEGATDEVEVEIVDDTPEQDRNRPRRAEGQEPEIPSDDEIANYSDNVQSRIKKLKFEYHEERRAKEEAERFKNQAVEDMKKLYEENQKLKNTLSKGEGALVGQAQQRIEAQLEKAKQAYKDAYESGDAEAITSASEQMAVLANEKVRYANYKPKAPKQQKPAQLDTKQYEASQTQPAQIDQKAVEWSEKNPWFLKDKAMTGYAYGVHEELIDRGVSPNTDDYYQEIDSRMREAFPSKFGQQRQQGSVVSPATRTAKSSRQVKLTKTQVDIARRLGLTPEKYAAQLLKEMQA